jgi:isochorismate pyruvate lyase
MTLEEIRQAIDELDAAIIELLAQRSFFVCEAAGLKKDAAAVRDTARVAQVLAGVREQAEKSGLEPDIAERIYREIISSFVDYEMKTALPGLCNGAGNSG